MEKGEAMTTRISINETHLDFTALRNRFKRNGKPLPIRTARDLGKKIPHMKVGKYIFWPLPAIEDYERSQTVTP